MAGQQADSQRHTRPDGKPAEVAERRDGMRGVEPMQAHRNRAEQGQADHHGDRHADGDGGDPSAATMTTLSWLLSTRTSLAMARGYRSCLGISKACSRSRSPEPQRDS